MKDISDIKRLNRNKVRRILWNGGSYTKQNLASETGLSVATCNTILNEMESSGEVTGEKTRLQEVGRSTVVYQINEAYESILCMDFKMIKGIKSLSWAVMSTAGTILERDGKEFARLDYKVILEAVREIAKRHENISQIIIGAPSVAEQGVIRHCDIPELEGVSMAGILASDCHIPVHMENDMHLKAYGYYKKECVESDTVTIAAFPSHVLPGTATIESGKVIMGAHQFAGMVGFLPYGIGREEQLLMLSRESYLPLAVKAAASIIAIVNPGVILFTGDLLDEQEVIKIKQECMKIMPLEYIPACVYRENVDDYFLEGMYQRALDLKGVL